MLSKVQTDEVEKKIEYVFKNKTLLNQALCHSSYANEHKLLSNERLEFLGDSVLNFIVTTKLFFDSFVNKEDEGALTVKRAELVSRKPLAEITKRLGLMRYLLLGEGAKQEQNISLKFFSNITEAIIGAIFLDSGNCLEPCEKFIMKNLTFDGAGKPIDYKSELQNLLQSKKIDWKYNTFDFDGKFKCELKCLNSQYDGIGKTKKEAEQSAAKEAILFLKKRL